MKPLAECADIISRHEHVALCWSGGKDSTAILFYLKDFWSRMTVYWLNTGDTPKETLDLADAIRPLIPNFVEINSNALEDMALNGFPFEAVPESLTRAGELATGIKPPIYVRPRLECCWSNIMYPVIERLQSDGVTLIIRGQKGSDKLKNNSIRDGSIEGGYEMLFPLQDDTDDDVLRWLDTHYPEYVHPAYSMGDTSLTDCLHCTANYGDGEGNRSKYPQIVAQRENLRRYISERLIEAIAV